MFVIDFIIWFVIGFVIFFIIGFLIRFVRGLIGEPDAAQFHQAMMRNVQRECMAGHPTRSCCRSTRGRTDEQDHSVSGR